MCATVVLPGTPRHPKGTPEEAESWPVHPPPAWPQAQWEVIMTTKSPLDDLRGTLAVVIALPHPSFLHVSPNCFMLFCFL